MERDIDSTHLQLQVILCLQFKVWPKGGERETAMSHQPQTDRETDTQTWHWPTHLRSNSGSKRKNTPLQCTATFRGPMEGVGAERRSLLELSTPGHIWSTSAKRSTTQKSREGGDERKYSTPHSSLLLSNFPLLSFLLSLLLFFCFSFFQFHLNIHIFSNSTSIHESFST